MTKTSFYIISCSLLVLISSPRVKCTDNMTDVLEQDTKPRNSIASTLIRFGKRTKNPFIQLLGKSFDSLEKKFGDVVDLVEEANIEKQIEETNRIETSLEHAINTTEHRLEQMITDKFETLAEEICRMHTCTEWSEWTRCDSDNLVDYGLQNRTRKCGKRASFCAEAHEPESEIDNAVCLSICPYNYTLTPSKYCVKLYTSIKMTRQDAELQCQIDGGHLINIDSASKSDEITDILKKENPAQVWIDGIQKARYAGWEFSYGKSSGHTNWDYNQWNRYRYRYPNCIYLQPLEWLWRDASCYDSYNFMCEFLYGL